MTKSNQKLHFVVYGREECHLCQEMIVALHNLQAQRSFDLEVIDIDKDAELVKRYNDKVPVLMSLSDQEEICHYHLDLAAFDAYVAKTL